MAFRSLVPHRPNRAVRPFWGFGDLFGDVWRDDVWRDIGTALPAFVTVATIKASSPDANSHSAIAT